jgi:hypothetical protein
MPPEKLKIEHQSSRHSPYRYINTTGTVDSTEYSVQYYSQQNTEFQLIANASHMNKNMKIVRATIIIS